MNLTKYTIAENPGLKKRDCNSSISNILTGDFSAEANSSFSQLSAPLRFKRPDNQVNEEYLSSSFKLYGDSGPHEVIVDSASDSLIHDRNLLEFERGKQSEYDELKEQITNDLILALIDFSVESEATSQAERKIRHIANEYSCRFLGDILQDIALRYSGYPKVLSGICVSLEGFDAHEVYPWGQTLFVNMVNNKSEMVKERVISLFENWEDTTLLPSLRNIEISSEWMREYFEDVITTIEDKECIT